MKQSHTRTRPGNSPSESTNQQVHIADTKQTGHNILFLNLKNKNMLQKKQNKTMKTKSLVLVIFFGFLTLFMVGCQKDDDIVVPQKELSLEDVSPLNKDMYDTRKITFDNSHSWKDIENIINQSGIEVLSVAYELPDRDGKLFGGEISTTILKSHDLKKSIQDALYMIISDPETEIPYSKNWNTDKPKSLDIDIMSIEPDVIKSITFNLIDSTILKQLSNQKSVKSIENLKTANENIQIQTQTLQTATASVTTWRPKYGTISAGQLSNGTRYVYNTMKWTDVSGFSTNSTYEHDFFLNNYSASSLPGTYLSRSENSQGQPSAIIWISDLPAYYLDTRFADPSGEVAYTIGSASAININANVWYFTRIVLNQGDASYDNAKLVSQLGHRAPSSCYTTWCSFGDANATILSAWTLGVPGGLSWQK